MIRTVHRTRGASALGATGPGAVGPFGRWPYPDEGDQADEQQAGDTADSPQASAVDRRPANPTREESR